MQMLSRENPGFVILDDSEVGNYEIRTTVLLSARGRAEPIGVLQGHFPVTERLSRMASSVEQSQSGYQALEITA